ncbi:MAG: DUF4031 domain-containing protein [Phycisphaerae bacterium]
MGDFPTFCKVYLGETFKLPWSKNHQAAIPARRLDLRRAWFQGESDLPHYDLTEYKRLKAIQDGAVEAEG